MINDIINKIGKSINGEFGEAYTTKELEESEILDGIRYIMGVKKEK